MTTDQLLRWAKETGLLQVREPEKRTPEAIKQSLKRRRTRAYKPRPSFVVTKDYLKNRPAPPAY